MSYLSDYANNVSQILQHRGDAQAQAALNRGQVWGRAIGQIGDAIGGIPAARQLQKDNEQKRADQAQQRQLTELQMTRAQGQLGDDQLAREKLKKDQAKIEQLDAFRAKTLGATSAEVEQLIQSMPVDIQAAARDTLTTVRNSNMENAKKLAKFVQSTGYNPEAAMHAAALAGKDEMLRFLKVTNMGENDDAIRQYVDGIASYGEKVEPPKTQVIKTVDDKGNPITKIVKDTPGQAFAGDPEKVTLEQQLANAFASGANEATIQGILKMMERQSGATRPPGDGQAKPYFTYQPVFDAQGRPISAIRFDARGGPPQVVDVAELTGGGQLKPPPGSLGADSIKNEVSVDQLNRLKEMFDKGAKDVIGPAEGRLRGLGQNIPGVPVDKTFSDFSAATSAFRNDVIKKITGAAMSEPEAKRILSQIPGETDKPDVWISKYEQTMKNLGDLNARLRAKTTIPGGSGGTPGNTESEAIQNGVTYIITKDAAGNVIGSRRK